MALGGACGDQRSTRPIDRGNGRGLGSCLDAAAPARAGQGADRKRAWTRTRCPPAGQRAGGHRSVRGAAGAGRHRRAQGRGDALRPGPARDLPRRAIGGNGCPRVGRDRLLLPVLPGCLRRDAVRAAMDRGRRDPHRIIPFASRDSAGGAADADIRTVRAGGDRMVRLAHHARARGLGVCGRRMDGGTDLVRYRAVLGAVRARDASASGRLALAMAGNFVAHRGAGRSGSVGLRTTRRGVDLLAGARSDGIHFRLSAQLTSH